MSAAAVDASPAKRSRVVAGLLSLIAPGVGHLYAGAPRRGLIVFLAMLALLPIGIVAAHFVPPTFTAVALFAVMVIALLVVAYLVTIIDAVRAVRRAGNARREPWFVLLGAVVVAMIVNFAASSLTLLAKPSLPWQTFSIASGSMQPTLRTGEWLLGDTAYYDKHAPARGDLVIYRLPSDNATIYVKRIVALGGDRIVFRDGRAVVNGVTAREPFADLGDAGAFYANTAEVTVPARHIFVAGDNRANSSDSRLGQHGMVPVKNLVARATEVFLSDDMARAGLWVGSPK